MDTPGNTARQDRPPGTPTAAASAACRGNPAASQSARRRACLSRRRTPFRRHCAAIHGSTAEAICLVLISADRPSACVVGAGAAGLVIAAALARASWRATVVGGGSEQHAAARGGTYRSGALRTATRLEP